jgi:hypothetical protein
MIYIFVINIIKLNEERCRHRRYQKKASIRKESGRERLRVGTVASG